MIGSMGMMRAGVACFFVVACGFGVWAQESAETFTFESDFAKHVIAADGRNVSFIDKASGTDYCDVETSPVFAHVKKSGKEYPVSSAAYADERLVLDFAKSGVQAIVRAKTQRHYITWEVLEVNGEDIEELVLLDVALKVKGQLDEPFAGCALALNLQTNVKEIPGPNKRLRAMCYPRFGMAGATVALIGCPMGQLRDVMKEVVTAAPDLPHSTIGGPWALDAAINRGSYLFDFGALTEKTVDDWIQFVGTLGLNQIDFHTGKSLRFGDYTPDPGLFPNGRASVRAVTDKLHAAGIAAGLHTYAFFIAKDSPYVTPVPDPRLGKDATFTLATALSAEAEVVPVVESTEAMSTTTGFFVRNSVTLQIDDELITYSGVSKEAPYAFTGCTRGTYGTKAAAHKAEVKVHHLKECFGLFAPDADSTLLAEVAANTASAFNECGFDMIYLDALDGEDILGGGANGWHYGSKFVFEIAKRLEKSALFEMSTFHHHLWYVRARMGAWDHPSRSHKRFIDVHVAANRSGDGMFLPMNIGWWAVKTWPDDAKAPQMEPTFPDDIEYLMSKALANDMGIALMGVNPGNIDSVPAYQRLAPIFRTYEELRHANYFPESIKAQLRKPGDEFTLEKLDDGEWQFRPVEYAKNKVQGIDDASNSWVVNNRFAAQPLQLRIEALMSAADYDATDAVVIEDFSAPEMLEDRANQEGVTATLESVGDPVKIGDTSGHFQASSERQNPKGSWAKIGKTFEPALNIDKQRALGVWVYGDGQGELLNIQLMSPHYTTSGGIGDHYIEVDFTGWRYFELIEMEGARIADYVWPYGKSNYGVYRETVNYGLIETLSLWYNNVPPEKSVSCCLSPIKAIPLVKNKLSNPKITVGNVTITFPVEIESGYYLEFRSVTDCKLYSPKGEIVTDVTPEGGVPQLTPGANTLEFDCGTASGNARAYVTAISLGDPLSG